MKHDIKMKVLHINCDFLGSNEVHRMMLKELRTHKKNDYDVFVPTKYSGYDKTDKNVYAIKCIGVFDRFFYYYKQHKIYRALRRCGMNLNKYECVHAFTLFTDGGIANKIHRLYKKPYIVAIRDTDMNVFLKYKPYLKSRARTILRESSKIVFLSESYRDALVKKLFKNKDYPYDDKTIIIPNGVDDYWMDNIYNKRRKIEDRDIKAIFVGKINKRKNVTMAQKAVDIYNDKIGNIHLAVVGKVEDMSIFNKLKKDKNVSYLGTKNKKQLLELYRTHDIFVMPSHTESFGIVYAEAMTQGLPVIYTRGQGFDRQFADGVVGYHVSDMDPNDIVNAIRKIVSNYDEICNNCTKKCQRFRWSDICREYDALYRQIAKVEDKISG